MGVRIVDASGNEVFTAGARALRALRCGAHHRSAAWRGGATRDRPRHQQEALAHNVEAAQANVAKAQAELELARSKRQRDAELLRTGFVSQAVLDACDAALRAAAANLESARAAHSARADDVHAPGQEARHADTQLTFTRITAPMDGVIISRQAEVGTMLLPGSPLFRKAATFVVMLVGGVVASLLAIWHAQRTPPQLALGG